MKKWKGRAVLCLILAAALMIGAGVFIVRLAADGDQWASFMPISMFIMKENWQ